MKEYEVILQDEADAEVENIQFGLMGRSSAYVNRWTEGFLKKLQSLRQMPRAYPLAQENASFSYELRSALYENYRILYTLKDADGDGEEDTVIVLHVRHTAQRPLNELDEQDDLP